ncbi:MAG TPA: hypothetical protein VGS09_00665 [Actinomycetota bacterium]|jgi:hypothetical protein|nr:hypothetical protein [Actinomycetota bacterium]
MAFDLRVWKCSYALLVSLSSVFSVRIWCLPFEGLGVVVVPAWDEGIDLDPALAAGDVEAVPADVEELARLNDVPERLNRDGRHRQTPFEICPGFTDFPVPVRWR